MTGDLNTPRGEAVQSSLRGTPIFASLSPEDDLHWLARCHTRSLCAGETLVDYEASSSEVFIVIAGELRAVLRYAVGKEAILGTFRRGDLIGELAAIDGGARSANLTAVTDSRVIVLPEGVFHDILKANFTACLALMQLLASRLRQTNERLSELTFLDTKHRLYNALLRLSRARGENSRERIISPPMVHAELAELIGSSRETVSREMSKLSREALLERTNRAIVLKNPTELSRRISKALNE